MSQIVAGLLINEARKAVLPLPGETGVARGMRRVALPTTLALPITRLSRLGES